MTNTIDRKVVLRALVGSHNYNLNTPESDKDYKVFVLPTFEDLYKGNTYSKQIIGDKVDLDIHDVRKLPSLFFKSNLNFLEVLFSKEVEVNHLKPLYQIRDEIAVMNLPSLFNSCGGMHLNKMKLLNKGTEGTQHLVDKFGYDTKQAQHAYRCLKVIVDFAENDFKDFGEIIAYQGEDKDFMQYIRDGEFKQDVFENFIKFFHDSIFVQLKNKYHSFKPNTELKEHLDNIIMKMVQEGL